MLNRIILTQEEYRKLFMEAIDSAYMKLTPAEADQIDKLVRHAQNTLTEYKVKNKSSRPSGFGDISALELIAKLGIWLNENKPIHTEIEGE
jgi:hypothetical protein